MSLSNAALVASISQVILAGTIGVVTIYIAWQQWRTNRNQFRLHLFDRRIAVYDAVLDLSMRLAADSELVLWFIERLKELKPRFEPFLQIRE
jgi:hypothetical protein